MKHRLFAAALALGLAGTVLVTHAQRGAAPPQAAGTGSPTLEGVLNSMTFRNIGPFRTAAWVAAVDVPEKSTRDHLYTIYAGSRSGGVWKTSNSGTTWTNVTDSVGVKSVGAVQVAPSDPNIVWVGTGDQANARSSISGKGMFKSTDAGKTWTFAGLPDSHHIARIVIHPTNPDIVYVAAIGHLFSKNEERGVFRTTDGGKSWKKVLYVNDGVGAVDLVMNRQAPGTLYAAMYDKDRKPWQIVESGPESGLFKTENGGDNWTKLTGGLPTGKIGRIGVDLYQKNPNILYALLENQNQRPGATDTSAASPTGPLARNIIGNELYRSDDAGKTWRKVTEENIAGGKAPYSFNQLKINPHNDQVVIVTSDNMFVTRDGGKTWGSDFFRGAFGDFRCMWWDTEDESRIILGSDGGVSVSLDGGRTVQAFPNMGVGEAYAIGVDMDDPYNVYAGFQDHDSWKGPSNGPMGRISLENWVTVGPGDGMYNQVDPTDSRWVYNTRELNGMGRMDQLTGVRTPIMPTRQGGQRLRWNWIAPIAISPHDPKTVYAGSQVLHRSKDRGDHWEEISPDLTTNDPNKIGLNVPYCTITSISESSLTAGLIWIGTDDGKVQLTQNAGGGWTDVTPALVAAGAPVDRWVSRVFASPFDPGTAFVAKNGFRNDDFRPFLYRTTDFGKTWTPIMGNLPNDAVNVVVQDRKNKNLYVVGNDIGVFVSIDAGAHWTRMKGNLPDVAVHDLVIHPRENDLVLGTYGRALWTGDITPLQELSNEMLAKNFYLFDIEPRARYGFSTQGMNYRLFGTSFLEVPNEPDALTVNYFLKSDGGSARVTIADADGKVLRTMNGPARAGLNRALITLAGGGAGGRGGGGGGGRGAGPGGDAALAVGQYTVTVEVGTEKLTKPAKVRERIR